MAISLPFILVHFSHAYSVLWCAAVACTGIIWSRYSMVITPVSRRYLPIRITILHYYALKLIRWCGLYLSEMYILNFNLSCCKDIGLVASVFWYCFFYLLPVLDCLCSVACWIYASYSWAFSFHLLSTPEILISEKNNQFLVLYRQSKTFLHTDFLYTLLWHFLNWNELIYLQWNNLDINSACLLCFVERGFFSTHCSHSVFPILIFFPHLVALWCYIVSEKLESFQC